MRGQFDNTVKLIDLIVLTIECCFKKNFGSFSGLLVRPLDRPLGRDVSRAHHPVGLEALCRHQEGERAQGQIQSGSLSKFIIV